jgi:hypothetical protein
LAAILQRELLGYTLKSHTIMRKGDVDYQKHAAKEAGADLELFEYDAGNWVRKM